MRSARRYSPPAASDCEPYIILKSSSNLFRTPVRGSVKQWAAVSTHDGEISEPPQKFSHDPSRNRCTEICQGAIRRGASKPPTMRVTARRSGATHSKVGCDCRALVVRTASRT